MQTISFSKPPTPKMLISIVDSNDLLITDYYTNHCRLKHLIENKISNIYLSYKSRNLIPETRSITNANSIPQEQPLFQSKFRVKRKLKDVECSTLSTIHKDESLNKTEKIIRLELPEVPLKRIQSANVKFAPSLKSFRHKKKSIPRYNQYNCPKEVPIKSLEFIYVSRSKQ
jgi:hypothetical protein